ncbi:MAG: hypothetical protein IID51_14420, partial [Proteobacteria bacterium]|nr:hypothetical protein [Pseudomonadota bacterium]
MVKNRIELAKVGYDSDTLDWHFDPQSIGFMIDIIPTIHKLYFGREKLIKTLDVGARTAAGTALLSKIHHPLTNERLRLDVTALDVSGEFSERVAEKYSYIDY